MPRQEAIKKLKEQLVRRHEALQRAVDGDLSLLRELHQEKTGDVLDAAADSGYSNWDQMKDGTIVVADYTNGAFYDAAPRLGPQPHIRAYRISEEELI